MVSVLQLAPIDIANWQSDEQFFNYPEGARSKNAVFPPQNCDLDFIVPNRRYLYKRSVRRYPDQFWGEVVAYQVGGLLGVDVPPSYAAMDSNNGDCGALIEWFYEDGKAAFVPGGNYMQLLTPDYDRKRGTQHNFHHVKVLARAFSQANLTDQDWKKYWAEAFLFDALIGNTDRHQDNWGYLFVKLRSGEMRATLSPLFDNGTSLGHERFVNVLDEWNDDDFRRYIFRGTHHMKWNVDDAKKCGHFEMIRNILEDFPHLKNDLSEKIYNFSVEALREKLDHLAGLDLPVRLSDERKRLYLKLVAMRKDALESVLR